MAKVNKTGSQKQEANTSIPKAAEQKKPDVGIQIPASKDVQPAQSKKGKNSRVGGTAVPGARSTAPRESNTTNPQQQQMESYNRDMRRRMQHLQTGPGQGSNVQNKRQKRLERRKKRLEERRQEIKKVAASGPRKISLGRRNTYFLIAVVVIIIVVIIAAIILKYARY